MAGTTITAVWIILTALPTTVVVVLVVAARGLRLDRTAAFPLLTSSFFLALAFVGFGVASSLNVLGHLAPSPTADAIQAFGVLASIAAGIGLFFQALGCVRLARQHGRRHLSQTYRFHILLTQEDETDFVSAIVLNLPGVSSCGDTDEEVLANVKEAISAALESYREAGEAIPWKDSSDVVIPPGARRKWIIQNA